MAAWKTDLRDYAANFSNVSPKWKIESSAGSFVKVNLLFFVLFFIKIVWEKFCDEEKD